VPQEFEGDLAGAVFWGADLTGASFRDVDLTDARISHAWLIGVEVDALVDRLVINGVDVTAYVNERDAWYPVRAMIRPTDAAGALAAWDELERLWADAFATAEGLPDGAPDRSVNGEFSLVQTLRHLVFAMDKWCTVPVLGGSFHPIGLPNTGSLEFGFPGLELSSTPTYAEARAVRADRAAAFRTFLTTATPADLTRVVDVLENGPHAVLPCIHTVLEEEFWHLRYATRDLELIAAET
jgi:hypothetical protein